MPFDPDRHHRRSIRLQGYDYAQAGAYFVTICVQGRECLLGQIEGDLVVLTPHGQQVFACWNALPQRYATLDLDAWVVMPNHMHGIILVSEAPIVAAGGETPPRQEGGVSPPLPDAGRSEAAAGRPTLGQIVAFFKYQSTKVVNQACGTPGQRLWQRNYYEHVIRNERSLERLREYIVINPLRWHEDQLHPDQPSKW
jgi:REP element-mobilizing transposase RayT